MKIKLDNSEGIMVIAPHCDDEILGCGGIIQQALKKGVKVTVVVVTNGDGFRWAAIRNFRRPFISYKKFREFGELRQRESVAALKKLGLEEENIYFLGYPDRGLEALWKEYWHNEEGYFSLYTKSMVNPYEYTYKLDRQYTGRNLVQDLEEIILAYKPDQVFVSSAYDDHPDHWAVYNFFYYALGRIDLTTDINYSLNTYQYLIHRGKWPVLKGDKLKPPKFLDQNIADWIYLSLTVKEREKKLKAVMEYKSQVKVMRKYLHSFVKDNELFAVDRNKRLAISNSSFIYNDPVKDTKRTRKLPGVDIKELKLNLRKEGFQVNLSTRNNITYRCQFQFYLYFLTVTGDKQVERKMIEFIIYPDKALERFYVKYQKDSSKAVEVSQTKFVAEKDEIKIILTEKLFLEADYVFLNIESYFKEKLADKTAWQVIELKE